MLTIHFTEEDLSLLTVSEVAEPMWEILASLYRLRRPEGEPFFGHWRKTTFGTLDTDGVLLMSAVPPYGYCPDFLTPAQPATSIEDGVGALRATPLPVLRAEIAELSRHGTIPRWLRLIRDGGSDELNALADAVLGYFRKHLAPDWPVVADAVLRESARCNALAEQGGAHLLLSALHPDVRWRPPFLEVRFPWEQKLDLRGRGLRLIPVYFGHGPPTTYKDSSRSPVLVYSIDHLPMLRPDAEPASSLAALLGPTRARVLVTVASGACNTSDVATRTGISAASASQHLTVLRESGLIDTVRRGRARHHTVTALGGMTIRAG
ncbi:ArsR/SmtB family transcription factor [Amycolatopsis keratiniphila]|uniref:ArsR/SmtB family transcription factor n=1 Tax=Amycolatopsis keratiniphila TaxID=129921 RepID=UPI00087A046A|nr:helix-turn-helix domain-containing protein [Amycolatopsis keratiniphila]OLZ47152.1 transcriptional regulator [Amycolatopsis keratiniphila subsp. nogabecina]SDU00167.1 Helix-turn-helix domain-containing protein [Amycolatopsis keratiniphila]